MRKEEVLAKAKEILEEFDEGKVDDILKFVIKAGEIRSLLRLLDEDYERAFDREVEKRLKKTEELIKENPEHPLLKSFKKAEKRKYALGIALTAFAHFPDEFADYVAPFLPFALKVYDSRIKQLIGKVENAGENYLSDLLLIKSMYNSLDEKGLLKGLIYYLKEISSKPTEKSAEELEQFAYLIFTDALFTNEEIYNKLVNFLDEKEDEIVEKASKILKKFEKEEKKKLMRRFGFSPN